MQTATFSLVHYPTSADRFLFLSLFFSSSSCWLQTPNNPALSFFFQWCESSTSPRLLILGRWKCFSFFFLRLLHISPRHLVSVSQTFLLPCPLPTPHSASSFKHNIFHNIYCLLSNFKVGLQTRVKFKIQFKHLVLYLIASPELLSTSPGSVGKVNRITIEKRRLLYL